MGPHPSLGRPDVFQVMDEMFFVNLHPDKIYFHLFRKDVVSVLKKHLSLVRMACNDIEEEATVPMTQI